MNQDMRRAFFALVAQLESQNEGACIATSIACLAVALARLHGQPKPVAGGDAWDREAMQELIDSAWPDHAKLSPEELQDAADLCVEHLRSRGVHVDLGIYAQAAGQA